MDSSLSISAYIITCVKSVEINERGLMAVCDGSPDDNSKNIRDIQKYTMDKGIIAEWTRLNTNKSTSNDA